jgi:hypothetical protein
MKKFYQYNYFIILCYLISLFGFLAFSTTVFAEIYKKVDENGHITYSNVPLKGASKLNLDPPSTAGSVSPRSAKTPTPTSFPKVDDKTQGQRDDKRKEILISELEAEQKALIEAKKAYAEGESNPEMFTNAQGKRFRNVPKFQEKMQKLQADVDAHERNIKLLQKEIDALN